MKTKTFWRCDVCHEAIGERKNNPCTFIGYNNAKPIHCPSNVTESSMPPRWKISPAFRVVEYKKRRKK